METVFLAHGFKDREREFAARAERLLADHGIRTVTGDVLEGQALTEEIKDLIAGTDGLIALLQERPQNEGGMSLWVRDELQWARTIGLPTLAVRESTVPVAGMHAENARIDFDAGKEDTALLDLSSRLALWKRKYGRRVKVRLLSNFAVERLEADDPELRCEYQLHAPFGAGVLRTWSEAALRLEPGGAFAHLDKVPAEAHIQLRLTNEETTLKSIVTPQWLHVELKEARS